jgi:hypothetical protein
VTGWGEEEFVFRKGFFDGKFGELNCFEIKFNEILCKDGI